MRFRTIAAAALLAVAACDKFPSATEISIVQTDFHDGMDGWVVEFADYPVGEEEMMELVAERRALPEPLTTSRTALLVSGSNRSDDLFMYLWRPIPGLRPHAEYRVLVEAEFATEAGSGCVGIGGAPGEAVYVKAGALSAAPQRIVQDGWYRVDFDKSNQSGSGEDAVVIDDVANGTDRCVDTVYRKKMVDSTSDSTQDPPVRNDLRARADARGTLWVLLGTDSGFEGTTALYYTGVRVTVER
jgi:hypothetical protein